MKNCCVWSDGMGDRLRQINHLTRVCLSVRRLMPTYCMDPDVTWGMVGVPPSCAQLGGFAISARVSLLRQHSANAKRQRVLVLALCLVTLSRKKHRRKDGESIVQSQSSRLWRRADIVRGAPWRRFLSPAQLLDLSLKWRSSAAWSACSIGR